MMFMHEILVRASALAICVGALVACGQQGPLYLPVKAAASQPTAPMQPAQTPTTSNDTQLTPAQ